MKRFALLLTLLPFFSILWAQECAKERLYGYYTSENMQAWKSYLSGLESATITAPDSVLWHCLEAEYGYIGWAISSLSEDERKRVVEYHLEHSFATIEELEDRGFSCSNLEAYRSAFYAYKIPIATYKAPMYGPKSGRSAAKAVRLDSNNPLAYIQSGHVAVYTPKLFGGSKEKAIVYYQQAIDLLEADSSSHVHNWIYLHALTSLAMTYDKLEEYAKSVRIYEKVLQIAPDFLWVKNDLYPKALKNSK